MRINSIFKRHSAREPIRFRVRFVLVFSFLLSTRVIRKSLVSNPHLYSTKRHLTTVSKRFPGFSENRRETFSVPTTIVYL